MKHTPKHNAHPFTVTYGGHTYAVSSCEAAWKLAWEHIPATIHQIEE